LPLPTGEVDAAVPARSELGLQPPDEVRGELGPCPPQRPADGLLVLETRRISDSHRLFGQQLEPHEVLESRRQPPAVFEQVEPAHIYAVEQDLAAARLVHAAEQ